MKRLLSAGRRMSGAVRASADVGCVEDDKTVARIAAMLAGCLKENLTNPNPEASSEATS